MITRFFSPNFVFNLASKTSIYLCILTLITYFFGAYFALFNSPADYQQGDMVRVMYIHVPAAWMSLMIYSVMASSSAGFIIWVSPIANEIAKSSSYIGAIFTFIALVTGAIWGKPIWGTWWVWDARLTSMLILFFFYLGYILLCNSLSEQPSSKAPAILAIVGFINVPIVKYSVDLWNSLHQPASIIKMSGPSIHSSMLKPLFIMIFASFLYYLWLLSLMLKSSILEYKIRRNEDKLF